ncbi:MAG: PHP domain-containing protein [Actinomycetota bacterium]
MIDLHTHTSLSDGSCTPTELLDQARQAGLIALAITDHDTLAGFDQALPHAHRYGLELVCGVEVSTTFHCDKLPGRHLSPHLLGYFLRQPPDATFRRWLNSISSTRRDRNLQLMNKLRMSNLNISWDDFPNLGPESAARPHFAKVLMAKGYVSSSREAFDHFLADSVLHGIQRNLPSTQDAIRKITENDGLAVLAHPARNGTRERSALSAVVDHLVKSGMSGIEVHHSDHSAEDVSLLLELATHCDLFVTGGSDFHGENKPDIRLGTGRCGNVHIPYELLQTMKSFKSGKTAAKER